MRGMESKAKLTLWVDKETVRFGKALAKQHHESLSGLVSGYLARLKEAGKPASISPRVQRLRGILKGRRLRLDRTDYRKHLVKKYLGS